MKSSLIVLALILLVGLCSTQYQYTNRFLVNVIEYSPPNLNAVTFRCSGTVISLWHVLAPASCVTTASSSAIGKEIHSQYGGTNVTNQANALGVKIHKDYKGNYLSNNIAVIWTSRSFDSTFIPRSLGALEVDSVGDFYGWGGQFIIPAYERMTIVNGSSCSVEQVDVFCSTFPSNNTKTMCGSRLGGAIICGTSRALAGYTLQSGCTVHADQAVIDYHSVDEFRTWTSLQTLVLDLTLNN